MKKSTFYHTLFALLLLYIVYVYKQKAALPLMIAIILGGSVCRLNYKKKFL
jgi:hypothetical protein